jgi:diacylglycerol kinase family enzyme
VIVSTLASRIRDAGVRSDVMRRVVAALDARGHRDVVFAEATSTIDVRTAAMGALERGSSLIVLAGGDGTIRDAAGVLAGTGIAVGILPCGTGNLYASSIGLSRDLRRALTTLSIGSPRAFDTGEVRLGPLRPASEPGSPTGMPFIVACGTGFDARLIAATSFEMKRRFGVAAYFLAAARLLKHLAAKPTTLTIDDEQTELEAVVVLVANCGDLIPGRARPRMAIDPGDGLLHVFVLPKGGVVRGLQGTLELMMAEAAGVSPSGSALRLVGRRVRVEVQPAQPNEVDGDPFGAGSLDARIRPGALSVLVRAP